MKPSRRMALVAAAVVFSLSACGSTGTSGSASGSDPTTAVSERPAPEVIELASATSSTKMAAGAAGGAEVSSDAATSMMAAPITFTYAGDVPDLGGEAPSWYFPAGVAATAEQVANLAAAFGITGEPTALPEEQGGGWIVGSTDYTGPSITISTSAMNDWWYNPGSTSASVSVGCVVPEVRPAEEPVADSDAAAAPADTLAVDPAVDPAVSAPCETPTPPTGVPSADEAEARARELFAGLGVDLAQYEFETSADEWGAYVTAYLVLDGNRTYVTMGVGFGGEGAIQWASGVLAVPQVGAAYPLRSTAAGLEELQAQQTAWMGGVSDAAGVKNAATDVATEPAPAVEEMTLEPCPVPLDAPTVLPADGDAAVSSPEGEAAPEVTIGLAPVDCAPLPMDPIEVTLTGVELDLTMVWAADGTVWLLPAYTFTSDDGGMYTVVAVDDAFLEAPAG